MPYFLWKVQYLGHHDNEKESLHSVSNKLSGRRGDLRMVGNHYDSTGTYFMITKEELIIYVAHFTCSNGGLIWSVHVFHKHKRCATSEKNLNELFC